MLTFVQLLNFTSVNGRFNEDIDTVKVNTTLAHLQSEGARILDIKIAIAAKDVTERSSEPIIAFKTVTIVYEAPEPI